MADQYRAFVRFVGSYRENHILFSFGGDNDPAITAGLIQAIKGYMSSLPNIDAQNYTKTETVESSF